MLHVDVLEIGIGIPKKLCAVLPPFNNVAAIPEDAAAIHLCPIPLKCASIPLRRYVLPQPPGALMLKILDPWYPFPILSLNAIFVT